MAFTTKQRPEGQNYEIAQTDNTIGVRRDYWSM